MQDQLTYVAAAYAVTGLGLAALTIMVVLHLRRWARRAREAERG